MRKVKFTKSIYPYAIPTPELKHSGYFHTFMFNGIKTCAIIEDENGQIFEVELVAFKFDEPYSQKKHFIND